MHSGKTIGILGGMGPAATVELFNQIVLNTPAKMDRDHVNVVMINDPQIPDRTDYILGRGVNPVPRMVNNLIKLSHAGANVAIMPCMTAHTFLSELQEKSPIPIINAIELVENYLIESYPKIEKVGLLATSGTVASGVFQKYITKKICVPDDKRQNKLMNIIYGENGIKAGNTSLEQTINIKEIIGHLRINNIQAVIAGCTEISLVLKEKDIDLPVIDPLVLLAKEAVKLGQAKHVKLKV